MPMRMGWLGLAAMAMTMAAASAQAERRVLTPSGRPDGLFTSQTLDKAAGRIANGCMNRGWKIVSQSSNQLVCEPPMNAVASVANQLLLGNSYSTPPRSLVRFNLAQIDGDVRVQADAWVETQMAFGQVRSRPYVDDATLDNLQDELEAFGAEPPPGTRFTTPFLGVFGPVRLEQGEGVMLVLAVTTDGAAERAGLQPGDRILRVNGRGFRSNADFSALVRRGGLGKPVVIDLERAGARLTLSAEAAPRPVSGTPEATRWKAAADAAAARAQAAMTGPASGGGSHSP